jgi:DHA3 family tetracycline resistance protein-like MFS transporter
MTLFRSLSVRPFALLLAGQTLSRVGDFLYQVVLAWWVLEATGSALAVGTVFLLSLLPTLIFGLIGGVAVDRFARIPIMLFSDVGRGVLITGAAVAAYAGALQVWHVYAISLFFGIVDAFFQPAYFALVPALVAEGDLPSANSLSSMSYQLGRVAGPPLGAALIGLGGTSLGFLVNGLSFFASAAFLLPLQGIDNRQQTTDHGPQTSDGLSSADRSPLVRRPLASRLSSFLTDVRAGFGELRRAPILGIAIAAIAVGNPALFGPFTVAMPFLVEESFGGNVNVLGLLYALFPIGFILGGVWLGRKSALRRRGLTLFLGGVVASVCLALFGLPLSLAILGAAAVVNGAGNEAAALSYTNTVQTLVPGEKLGRVSSIETLATYALIPFGFMLAALVTEAWGPRAAFLIGGGLGALAYALPLLHPAVRRFD